MHIVIVSVALLFQSSALYYFFEYVNYFSIDKRPTLGPKVAVTLGDLRRLKATLGDFSLFCPKLRAILGYLRRFWATLGDFGRF